MGGSLSVWEPLLSTSHPLKAPFCLSSSFFFLSHYPLASLDVGYLLLATHHSSAAQPPRSGAGTMRRYPISKVRSKGREEIPHVQGQRNSSKTVVAERGHQRADRNHNHRKLTNLITWTIALSNSMKL